MEIPINLDHADQATLQKQLFDELRTLILKGQLKSGIPVPGTRVLARQLGVSRNTVLLSYDRLIAEGYLETRKAVGTFVSDCLPDDTQNIQFGQDRKCDISLRQAVRQPMVFKGRTHRIVNENLSKLLCDFWVGRPDPHTFPSKVWQKLINRRLHSVSSKLTEYHDPGGIEELRKAIADRLGPTRGIAVSPEQVLIVAGCQEALNIVARLFVQKGTRVVIENPCYQGAAYLFESYGAKLQPIPVDDRGICTSELPTEPATLAYVTPSHQYPTGSTMALERRLALLEWAWKNGAYVVEDDYDSDFRYHGSPLTALRGLDERGCVIYLGTFSKSLGAGLRLGYLVVPKELVKPALTVKALLNNGHAWLDQAVLSDFLTSGRFDTHVRRIRQLYLSRRNCLVTELKKHFGDVKLSGVKGGMHVLWHLPPGFPQACEFQDMAFEVGVGIYCMEGGGAHEFGETIYSPSTIMLGYSSVTEPMICRGISRIAKRLSIWSNNNKALSFSSCTHGQHAKN